MNLVLQANDVNVHFGGVQALDRFSIAIEAGEIHGLIGPNGAGKTTALNVLTGLLPHREGQVLFEGKPLPLVPHLIAQSGLGRTFQSSAIFPGLTAGENVMCAGHRWTRSGWLSCMFQSPLAKSEEQQLRRSAELWMTRVDFGFPFDTPAKSLPFGEQRKIEIARALMAKPRLLLLDEPTAGLTADEVLGVAKLLKSLQEESEHPLSILLVEHNVPFIFSLCDRVTAIDKGANIATGSPSDIRAKKEVIASYLGGEAAGTAPAVVKPVSGSGDSGKPILEVIDIEAGYGRVKVIRDLRFSINAGELVVICGRNGAGKSTLLNALVGNPRISCGEVRWLDQRVDQLTVSQIVRRGLALVPQERGIISEQSVEANLRLSTVGLRISRAELKSRRDEMFDRFPKLKDRGSQLAGTLSGGERQMLALAKVLIRRPKLLLLDEPSIGLAPTILEDLQRIVSDINRDGISVLVAEQNVRWVAPLATRAFLLEGGRFVAEGAPEEIIHQERVLENFLGGETMEPATASAPHA